MYYEMSRPTFWEDGADDMVMVRPFFLGHDLPPFPVSKKLCGEPSNLIDNALEIINTSIMSPETGPNRQTVILHTLIVVY